MESRFRKLREIVRLSPGVNPTRIKKQYGLKKLDYYDQTSFDNDNLCKNETDFDSSEISLPKYNDFVLCEGDVVISNASYKAAIVSRGNGGKVLSNNFIKVEFISDKLDKDYFLFIFNQHDNLQKQKVRDIQMNGIIQRITVQSIYEMRIPILDIEEQKKIGKVYVETLKLQNKLASYSALLEKLSFAILESNVKGF